ncbi:hypothetical protein [Paracoccus seriniphilus]|uniref:hypothetical protein n=1 Tax=Paracoccus seriniphilus TaxID=184748 RepID=UPI003563D404
MVRLLLICLALLMPAPAMSQEARLMILHDHGNPVQSEMVRLRIRGEYDLTISLEDMQFPNSSAYDWIQIARDDWHKERVHGRLLQIFERQVAVFPRQPGPVTVGPLSHDLTYVTTGGGREQITVTAPEITLNVHPFPADHSPLSARDLTLTDELSAQPGALKKDEVLTRRVTIEALGTLAHYLPPRPDIRQPWMISYTKPEIRETVLTEDGPVARVEWEWQMRPHTGEPAILPGIGFPWFDTDSRQIRIAPLKPIPFGFAGFGTNFEATQAPASVWLLAGVPLLSFLITLLVLLLRRRPARRRQLRLRLRRLLPSPHVRAMKAAARRGDLPAQRKAIALHEERSGTSTDTSSLDRQIYACDHQADFNPTVWLQSYLAANRSARWRMFWRDHPGDDSPSPPHAATRRENRHV